MYNRNTFACQDAEVKWHYITLGKLRRDDFADSYLSEEGQGSTCSTGQLSWPTNKSRLQ